MSTPGHGPSTKWKPGQSGNPKGRPPAGMSMAETLRRELEELGPPNKKTGERVTKRELIMRMLITLATAGDEKAIKMVLDFTTSKPAIDLNQNIIGAMNVTVVNPPRSGQ